MPTWRQGQAVGEWRQIPGTALASAPMAVVTGGNTGPQSKVIAWNGFSIDTRDSSIYAAATGGHHDYAGNEVNRIRLSDSAPKWTEPRAATPLSKVLDSVTHYADGRPTSRHTFYGAAFNEPRGRVMLLGGSRWGNGWPFPSVDGFNIATNDWDPAKTYPDTMDDFTNVVASAVVAHKTTGDIYAFGNYGVMRWSNSTNKWSQLLSGTNAYGQYAAAALDTKRNRILLAGGLINERSYYDIATNTIQTVSFSGPNAGAMAGDTGNGMVYDPLLDAYLMRKDGSGGTIYRINAQTFSVDTLPTSAGASIPAAVNGVWTRFLYVPQLKGVVYFPAYEGNGWFIRTN